MANASTVQIKGFTLACLALGGGVLGGFLSAGFSHAPFAQAAGPQAIRVKSVELIDATGHCVATLGTDSQLNVSLAFFDIRGKKRAEFGLSRGENPRLDINEPRGNSVLSLDLGEQAKPRLMLSDADFTGRVYLGVAEPDAPSPAWKYDNWILRFTGNNTRPLAIIGMTTTAAGGIAVFDQAGHAWRSPIK